MRKPRSIIVIEPDPSLRRLLERVVERAAPGIPAEFAYRLDAGSPTPDLVIYDVSAGWEDLVEWRRSQTRSPLVLLLGAVAGLEHSSVAAVRPSASFGLPFPYSELEDFIRQFYGAAPLKRSCRVVS